MHKLRTKLANMSPRSKHHLLITLAVGSATLAHYLLAWLAPPSWINLSPLAGFAASLAWIWIDQV